MACVVAFVGLAFVLTVAAGAQPAEFADVTDSAGITFVHTNGAFGEKYLPETMGAGGVVLDIDGDGWQDILLVDSSHWPGRGGDATHPVLYRNDGDGTFTDVHPGIGTRGRDVRRGSHGGRLRQRW